MEMRKMSEVLFKRVFRVSEFVTSGVDVNQTCSVTFDDSGTLTLRFVNDDNVLVSKIVYCLRQSRVLEVAFQTVDQTLRATQSATNGHYVLRIDGSTVPLVMSSEDFELFFDVAKNYLCKC